MNDKIKQLQKEIEVEQEKMRKCKHTFGEPYYNPEKEMKGYGYKMVAQGSDVYGEFEGYIEVNVPRWTRKCTECKFEQHTKEQKPIIKGFEPDFK